MLGVNLSCGLYFLCGVSGNNALRPVASHCHILRLRRNHSATNSSHDHFPRIIDQAMARAMVVRDLLSIMRRQWNYSLSLSWYSAHRLINIREHISHIVIIEYIPHRRPIFSLLIVLSSTPPPATHDDIAPSHPSNRKNCRHHDGT